MMCLLHWSSTISRTCTTAYIYNSYIIYIYHMFDTFWVSYRHRSVIGQPLRLNRSTIKTELAACEGCEGFSAPFKAGLGKPVQNIPRLWSNCWFGFEFQSQKKYIYITIFFWMDEKPFKQINKDSRVIGVVTWFWLQFLYTCFRGWTTVGLGFWGVICIKTKEQTKEHVEISLPSQTGGTYKIVSYN